MLSIDDKNNLIKTAIEARQWAYAPYSKYAVGAAVLASSGRVYDGVNVENAAFPSGVCAERVAIFKAVSQGERNFKALAVVTSNGGWPCGACRQVMAEFGLDTWVIIADEGGNILKEASVSDILPGAFTPEHLN